METAPLFSVVVIARNEAKTLSRLAASLKEFLARGGEFIVVDTGSTDSTAEVALECGAKVIHKGCDFVHRLGWDEAEEINKHFLVGEEEPIVKADLKFFDYAEARNCAALQASNEVIAMPDCDEIYTALDIDKINESIRAGTQQFEYDFVFSHDTLGRPLIQFMHCKFYDRRKLKWQGVIHEVLVNTGIGDPRRQYLPPEVIKLEHWQNPETNRGGYLTGLAVDCYQHPENDRNSHYFARELMWSNRPKSALKEFGRHILMSNFAGEKAQSLVYCGEIREGLGQPAALDCYLAATVTDRSRRIGFLRLAQYYYKRGHPQETLTWATASLTVPWNSYYGNNMADYQHVPHEMLYWANWQLGDKAASETHWKKCLEYEPHNTKFLGDAQFYIKLPKVSIIIPHVVGTRMEPLAKCQALIKQNANYPSYEVIIAEDDWSGGERRGVAAVFNDAVEFRASGTLVMFLGDDCEPQENFLIEAVLSHLNWQRSGLTALNDGLWNGFLATHWIADRDFRDWLPNKRFLDDGYQHVGCDNELTGYAKFLTRYNYAEHANIIHKPVSDAVHRVAWDEKAVEEDRARLRKRAKQFGFEVI